MMSMVSALDSMPVQFVSGRVRPGVLPVRVIAHLLEVQTLVFHYQRFWETTSTIKVKKDAGRCPFPPFPPLPRGGVTMK